MRFGWLPLNLSLPAGRLVGQETRDAGLCDRVCRRWLSVGPQDLWQVGARMRENQLFNTRERIQSVLFPRHVAGRQQWFMIFVFWLRSSSFCRRVKSTQAGRLIHVNRWVWDCEIMLQRSGTWEHVIIWRGPEGGWGRPAVERSQVESFKKLTCQSLMKCAEDANDAQRHFLSVLGENATFLESVLMLESRIRLEFRQWKQL